MVLWSFRPLGQSTSSPPSPNSLKVQKTKRPKDQQHPPKVSPLLMALPTIAQIIAAGVDRIRDNLPATAIIGANSYTVGKAMSRREDTYTETGAVEHADFAIAFLQSELTANSDNPQPNDKVTVDGTIYRIIARKADSLGVHVHCEIGALYP